MQEKVRNWDKEEKLRDPFLYYAPLFFLSNELLILCLNKKRIKYWSYNNPRILAHIQICRCIKQTVPLQKMYILKLVDL